MSIFLHFHSAVFQPGGKYLSRVSRELYNDRLGGYAIYQFYENAQRLSRRILINILLFNRIVLDSAYSLNDRVFYHNLGTILLYAVVGTLLNFAMIGKQNQ